MTCKILIVGDCYEQQDRIMGKPFTGHAGRELMHMLQLAGVNSNDCAYTAVFRHEPMDGDVESFFLPKAEHKSSPYPGIKFKNKLHHVKPEFESSLADLRAEIEQLKPNLVLALGSVALWATSGETSINAKRGTIMACSLVPEQKLLATLHPKAVLRLWSSRPTAIADLQKAAYEGSFPEFRRLRRELWLEPTLDDIREFKSKYLDGCSLLSFDIETIPVRRQITCIGFAGSIDRAICIPFVDKRRDGYSYWPSARDEVRAWTLVREILDGPEPKLGWNGLYDMQWLWRVCGIPTRNYLHDGTFLHHALQPELKKSLGYCASIYTNEPAWKDMRTKDFTEKRDD